MHKFKYPIDVLVIFYGKLKLNIDAISFAILSLNKIQDCFEFSIYEEEKNIFCNQGDKEAILFEFDKYLREKNIFKGNAKYVAITDSEIMNNWFHVTSSSLSIITTNDWLRSYSPPNYIEYIINSIVDGIIFSITETESHEETRGCCLDYTEYKKQLRWGIHLGYICNRCKQQIIEKGGEQLYNCLVKISSFDWTGEINEYNSIANKLKKYFDFDIEKDTGLQKKLRDRFKETFVSLPKEVISGVITGAIIAILSFVLGRLTK